MGQRSPYKDFETVVNAWALIPEAARPRLAITGSHGADPLAPLVARLGLEPWVTLSGWIPLDELHELFGTATALIDSTLATGFSMPTLEAMSAGLPVLLADTEVFREVGADSAAYFAAGSPPDLARAVVDLASSPTTRRELSERGRVRAAQFSWDRVASETLLSFARVLSPAH
jgi:alpha-1,3-rhamnosyl/mannosyltransferase